MLYPIHIWNQNDNKLIINNKIDSWNSITLHKQEEMW